VNRERAVDAAYLDIRKIIEMVCHSFLDIVLSRYGVGIWTVR